MKKSYVLPIMAACLLLAGCSAPAEMEAAGVSSAADSAAQAKVSAAGAAKESDDAPVSGAEPQAAGGGTSENKVYKIATDTTFAPFEFENENGKMVGIDLDLLEAIAADQGFDYELQLLGFSAACTALESGEVDAVLAGMSITDERKQKYDFSEPYFDSGVGMGVPADSGISSYEDLKGKQVAAKIGAEGCAFAESVADRYGFTIMQFEDSAGMFQDVLAGTSAACFDDYPVIGYEISRGLDLSLPLPMERGSSYGFAVLKGENKDLLRRFNAGLAKMKETGKYQEIVDTYVKK